MNRPCPECGEVLTIEFPPDAGPVEVTEAMRVILRAHVADRHPDLLAKFDGMWVDLAALARRARAVPVVACERVADLVAEGRKPGAGFVLAKCERCTRTVWIGPEARAAATKRGAEPWCTHCIADAGNAGAIVEGPGL